MWKKWMLLPAAMLAFVACSDDSSSPTDAETTADETFTTEEGSSAVAYNGDGIFYTDKGAFDNDSLKNEISVYEPVCKVQGDTLFWSDGRDGEAVKMSYKYNASSKSINVQKGGDKFSMKFYGDTFPYGQWIEPNAEIGTVYNGFSLHLSGNLSYTKFFGDSCLVDNLVAIKAFPGFPDPSKMEKVDCNTAKYADVEIAFEEYSAGVATLTASKDDEKCKVTIKPRFKALETDCKAAFEDFEDAEAEGEFDFADYDVDISGDTECFEELVK